MVQIQVSCRGAYPAPTPAAPHPAPQSPACTPACRVPSRWVPSRGPFGHFRLSPQPPPPHTHIPACRGLPDHPVIRTLGHDRLSAAPPPGVARQALASHQLRRADPDLLIFPGWKQLSGDLTPLPHTEGLESLEEGRAGGNKYLQQPRGDRTPLPHAEGRERSF